MSRQKELIMSFNQFVALSHLKGV